jgi:hypothetical protein
VSVQALLVEDHWDPEPRIVDKELLNRVRSLGHFARVQAFTRVAGTSHLTEAVAVFERLLGLCQIEVSVGIHKCLRLLLPDAEHLRGFFFQSHARQ